MKRILFLIHDLGQGGAEKVLINLVNNMDRSKFDITVMTLFDIGVNKQFLSKDVHYKTVYKRVFPGNSHFMKLLTPMQLHKKYIKERYDIEVSYLEGPCARIISGCKDKDTRIVTWIHREQFNAKVASASFRSVAEAEKFYNKFNDIICVSETVKNDFCKCLNIKVPVQVLYNTNETEKIRSLSEESVTDVDMHSNQIKLVGVGKLLTSKGFDRILSITKRLIENNYPVHTYILGIGPEESNLKEYAKANGIEDFVTLLGYQTNPYKYVRNCDLFVCASHAEGFSTAATEALIVGTPVCTVEVSGMKEMLGDNNEYGVVTENDDEALYQGIKSLLDSPELLKHYTEQAKLRGKDFSTENTVKAVEEMLTELIK